MSSDEETVLSGDVSAAPPLTVVRGDLVFRGASNTAAVTRSLEVVSGDLYFEECSDEIIELPVLRFASRLFVMKNARLRALRIRWTPERQQSPPELASIEVLVVNRNPHLLFVDVSSCLISRIGMGSNRSDLDEENDWRWRH